jgi:tripartite-type tricarboxylate transporter receptor subunit TctC
MLKAALGIPMTHIPYKGPLPALTDVAGGHIALMFTDVLNAMPLIDAGKLRMLAISTPRRMEAVREVPTLTELGIDGFDLTTSFMFFVPDSTPQELVTKLNSEIRDLMNDADVQEEFARQGVVVVDSPTPNALSMRFQAEIARWTEMVRRAGLAGSE